eukprot:SAG31_NODE_820_length_11808_cov_16.331540_6_plen_38_part_00
MQVSLEDFERFFAHTAAGIEDDDYFALMMRQAWGVYE